MKAPKDLNRQLNLRASVDDVERLDRLALALSERTPGVEVTRSSAARAAILRGLDALEAELLPAKKTKPKA